VSSNFAFLAPGWPALAAEARRAEASAASDPRTACFYARRTLELAVQWLYRAEAHLRPPYKDDLSALLFEPSFRTLVGPGIHAKMDVIRRQGNAAVHRTSPITSKDSIPIVRELFHVLFWLARRYSMQPVIDQRFDAEQIPRPVPADVRAKRQAEIQQMASRLAEQDEQLAQERAKHADLDAELQELRAQVAAVKAANASTPDTHDYDEDDTRDLFIDLLLREAGWPLDEARDREFEVSGMPNEQGIGFCDYVLWGDNGKPLAVVEAKRTRRDPQVGQQQAKLYADCLERMFGQRPVIFYTNGYQHWLWDDTQAAPRAVQGFYTKDELALLIGRRSARQPLAGLEIQKDIAERPYQHKAIRAVAEAFETGHQREALLVMATGAGKTRTTIALVELLMRAGWVKRVLFLADRVALVNQAANAFKSHLPDVTTVNLVTEKATDGRVYVSTYPTMLGLINGTDDGERRFGPGYFDLVVIDEAHRSVYQKYRAIFTWFDSLLLGLTATPKDEVDHNTYRLFNLEDGVPTDAYSLAEAIEQGYLVPPTTQSVPLKFIREGIRYDQLPDDEKDHWDSLEWADDDPPAEVDPQALNQWLFNIDTVDKVLATLMTDGRKVAGGDRLGKTIIFAKNNAHAQFIAERFDINYPQYAGKFARIITYQTEYAQSLIDDFTVKDKDPHIAISVDMLDTGIDVPEIVNLVFFKMVRSKSKFWQMLGRGTRLCKDLYGPGADKTDFLVLDFCQNLEYFNQDLPTAEGRLVEPLSQRLFKARVDLLFHLDKSLPQGVEVEFDGTHSEEGLRTDLANSLRWIVGGMTLDNVVVRPERLFVERYADEAAWRKLDEAAAGELADRLSGLPSQIQDTDEAAKRFDLLALRMQLATATADPSAEKLRKQIQQIASALLEQTAIPVVKAQEGLLLELASDEWWVDVTLPMIELARRRIRSLVALIPKSRQPAVFVDFTDDLGEVSEVRIKSLVGAGDFARFREKARRYLREHEDHVAVQKLRRNRQLTSADLLALEAVLLDAGIGDRADLDRAQEEAQGLGLFVRELLGLDEEAARKALTSFIEGKTFSAAQLNFLDLVVQHLIQSGVVPLDRLYASPYTDIAPGGPEDLFSGSDIEGLVAVLDQLRSTAVASA
jgi:type I restriction enzyme R subunit